MKLKVINAQISFMVTYTFQNTVIFLNLAFHYNKFMLTLFRGLADIKNFFKESCQSHKHSILKKLSV